MLTRVTAITVIGLAIVTTGQQRLVTDQQAASAIALGQQGNDFSVRVGTLQVRGGTCGVFIAGPLARIAAAAAAESRRYRPFTLDNVTPSMKEVTYAVGVVVRGAFTEKGAAERVGRDLARKLAVISR